MVLKRLKFHQFFDHVARTVSCTQPPVRAYNGMEWYGMEYGMEGKNWYGIWNDSSMEWKC